MDTLLRFVFVLLAAAAGFLPGGLLVRALLGDRPRTGFDGVAEVFFGSMGGIVLGLILGYIISGRLERSGRLWGIVLVVAVIGIEVATARFLA
ncbi:MAG: hypothetical protein KF753_11420 [Caldilineaceae bacterium]|nr:hypothetical protein [Caldilineaceae bacterium]